MPEAIGLYIHVPFCVSKCPYCDFYSQSHPDEASLDAYTAAAERSLREWGDRLGCRAATLYFGGGTPSLLGGERLTRLLEAAEHAFGWEPGAEITLEANPGDELADTLAAFRAAGGNRLSLGMQSADPEELRLLGRRHTPDDVARAVEAAHRAGLDNLSLDLMLGLPGQTADRVRRSVETCRALGAAHVSAYLLKVEPGTPFAAKGKALGVPDADEAADLYEAAAEALETAGFAQYEISNFARPGRESRHNLTYWDQRPYLGIGPAAHSFLDGQRFAYPRDRRRFIEGGAPLPEPEDLQIPAGSAEEYLMLRLRLCEGVREAEFAARFGRPIPAVWRERAAQLPPTLVRADAEGIRLTRAGFLVSNAILRRLLALD